MTISTMYEILTSVVGEPADDIQKTLLYMGAICISIIVMFFIIYLFKVISGLLHPDSRG